MVEKNGNGISEAGDLKELRDIVYFDIEKAASLYSQLEAGLPTGFRLSEMVENQLKGGGGLGLGPLRVSMDRQNGSKVGYEEVRILHHHLLSCLEAGLSAIGLLTDISENELALRLIDDEWRRSVLKKPYIRTEGWPAIEDHRDLGEMADKVNRTNAFIRQCALAGSDKFNELAAEVQRKRRKVEQMTERNKKRKAERELRAIENQIAELSSEGSIPQWIVEGIRAVTTDIMPNLVTFRVFPDRNNPVPQVVSHLKPDCFFGDKVENLLTHYSAYPDVQLVLLGLVTRVPSKLEAKDARVIAESAERDSVQKPSEVEAFETATRAIFPAWEGLMRFTRYCRYPRISVFPIAVYRRIRRMSA
ncbi:hypothetical protein J7J84_03390 [bacterium]|nr:hypothetical protein [bacterium]